MNIQLLYKNKIHALITQAGIDFDKEDIIVEFPESDHGDVATPVCFMLAKNMGMSPRDCAKKIVSLWTNDDIFEVPDIAGPGYLNARIKSSYMLDSLHGLVDESNSLVSKSDVEGSSVMVEYLDPNPFKLLHIGHMMTGIIGDAIARHFELAGAQVKHACYQGDVGMHVAKTIWGMQQDIANKPADTESLQAKVSWLGSCYANGATQYKEGNHVDEIRALNVKIYNKDDSVRELYQWGRLVSLQYFETQYNYLGIARSLDQDSAFDHYFFESEASIPAMQLVQDNIGDVFTESDGAVIYEGERHGLHTRVFINSQGLPTYEAKELALAFLKDEFYDADYSVVVTGNEIEEYFKVLLKAMNDINQKLSEKTEHITHGMMRFNEGKMSSRTGDVVTAYDFVSSVASSMKESYGDAAAGNGRTLSQQLALGAIKFWILKQDKQGNVIYDSKRAETVEGDTGPYLQYTYARLSSLLRKQPVDASMVKELPEDAALLAGVLLRAGAVLAEACHSRSPHTTAQYALDVAHACNSWYGNQTIINPEDNDMHARLLVVAGARRVLKTCLYALGIESPEEV